MQQLPPKMGDPFRRSNHAIASCLLNSKAASPCLGDELLSRKVVEVKPGNKLCSGLLPSLLLSIEALVVAGRHGISVVEYGLGVLDHVAGLGLERLGREGEAALVLVLEREKGGNLVKTPASWINGSLQERDDTRPGTRAGNDALNYDEGYRSPRDTATGFHPDHSNTCIGSQERIGAERSALDLHQSHQLPYMLVDPCCC